MTTGPGPTNSQKTGLSLNAERIVPRRTREKANPKPLMSPAVHFSLIGLFIESRLEYRPLSHPCSRDLARPVGVLRKRENRNSRDRAQRTRKRSSWSLRMGVWRGAALRRVSRPDGISLYHVLRPGNSKAGGSRELPSAVLCPGSLSNGPIEQPNAGSFSGAACSHPFRPDMPQSKCRQV